MENKIVIDDNKNVIERLRKFNRKNQNNYENTLFKFRKCGTPILSPCGEGKSLSLGKGFRESNVNDKLSMDFEVYDII